MLIDCSLKRELLVLVTVVVKFLNASVNPQKERNLENFSAPQLAVPHVAIISNYSVLDSVWNRRYHLQGHVSIRLVSSVPVFSVT